VSLMHAALPAFQAPRTSSAAILAADAWSALEPLLAWAPNRARCSMGTSACGMPSSCARWRCRP
jgi:hypothetical protein